MWRSLKKRCMASHPQRRSDGWSSGCESIVQASGHESAELLRLSPAAPGPGCQRGTDSRAGAPGTLRSAVIGTRNCRGCSGGAGRAGRSGGPRSLFGFWRTRHAGGTCRPHRVQPPRHCLPVFSQSVAGKTLNARTRPMPAIRRTSARKKDFYAALITDAHAAHIGDSSWK
jgi:hypothetical protein